MNIIALVIALAALFVFGLDVYRSRSEVCLGLFLLTLAWIAQLVISVNGGDPQVSIDFN